MPSVAVVGGGPAGLMAADVLARAGVEVTVFDRMGSIGRKFLLAGRGGLNITHSEELPRVLARYSDANPLLRAAVESFPPDATRAWCHSLGQSTFIGSSGRVFPDAFKSSPLLRAWLRQLLDLGVQFKPRHRWIGWDDAGALKFETAEGIVAASSQACVLALGGASWPRLGADGSSVGPIAAQGITIAPLRPANCGFLVPWSELFSERFAGQPLKRIALSFGGRTVRGEAMITRHGIEGGAIYALSAALRDAIATEGGAVLEASLRPTWQAPNCVAGLKHHATSSRWRRFCARRSGCHPSPSDFSTRSPRASSPRLM